jgi:calpain
VKQGALGDCWFIGALSVLAAREDLMIGELKDIEIKPNFKVKGIDCEKLSKGVYPPIFHIYSKKGLYVLRFFKDFKWRYVIIDDRLPCTRSSYRPYYATCTNLEELWVPLIEKAYAKLHGCYQALISGHLDDGIDEMTGLVSDKMRLHDNNKVFPNKAIKDKD